MKALITQRESIDNHGVAIDIMESSYIKFFEELNLNLIPVSNFQKKMDALLQCEFVILTGGGSVPYEFYDQPQNEVQQKNRDLLEKKIVEQAINYQKPIIAICRGMQFLNGMFGGKISSLASLKVPRPIGVDHPILLSTGEKILVNNYHNYGIIKNDLSNKFRILALDENNDVVEGMYSNELRVLGLQWHPERTFSSSTSYNESRRLIEGFIKNRGRIDEGYYFGRRSGD